MLRKIIFRIKHLIIKIINWAFEKDVWLEFDQNTQRYKKQ